MIESFFWLCPGLAGGISEVGSSIAQMCTEWFWGADADVERGSGFCAGLIAREFLLHGLFVLVLDLQQ